MDRMNTLDVRQAADYLGRAVKTLQRWERQGRLIPSGRTPTNRRVYNKEQLDSFLGQRREVPQPTRIVAYCRVSSVAQKPDLKNQRTVIEEFCVSRGLADVEYLEEIAGGLNFKRKVFAAIMDSIEQNEIAMLVIAHKDRLCRFGFEWFERHCKKHGCEMLILNTEKVSPEQEMVQDLMTIVHCFSSRLYGLRNYRKALKEALKIK